MPVLELQNISKHFGAIQALNDVSLRSIAGEVVGPDGRQRRRQVDAGEDHRRQLPPTARHDADGRRARCVLHRPVEARQHGIEIVYQDLALCDNLTAAANVFLGRELRAASGRCAILDYAAMYRRAGELFTELKSETRPRDLVEQMSGGQRQAVAIARTRLSEPKIVLMDEPTAAISRAPGRRGAEPDPPAARPGHRGRADQPPHARRVRRRRPHHRAAARPQGRRQADRRRARPRRSPASSPARSNGMTA